MPFPPRRRRGAAPAPAPAPAPIRVLPFDEAVATASTLLAGAAKVQGGAWSSSTR
jgi:hypothetical protein